LPLSIFFFLSLSLSLRFRFDSPRPRPRPPSCVCPAAEEASMAAGNRERRGSSLSRLACFVVASRNSIINEKKLKKQIKEELNRY
jgi:hypothetical protein